jgi:hypothetical protein
VRGASEKQGKQWMGFGVDPGKGCVYRAKHVLLLEEIKAAAVLRALLCGWEYNPRAPAPVLPLHLHASQILKFQI